MNRDMPWITISHRKSLCILMTFDFLFFFICYDVMYPSFLKWNRANDGDCSADFLDKSFNIKDNDLYLFLTK